MRCTSPLFRVKDYCYRDGIKTPSLYMKKRLFGYKDYFHLINNYGYNASDFVRINCGQCLACRILHAKQWAERCLLEAFYHENNYFLTLTYNDDNLPMSDCGFPMLVKSDLQKAFKRFRKHYGKFRYFACGEYGDTSFRPHYHVVAFGLNGLDDLIFLKTQKSKSNIYEYFYSPKLESIWGKGFCLICKVTSETCAYTARYSLKKIGVKRSANVDNPSFLDLHNQAILRGELPAPFLVMSRKPGIGRYFYEDHKEVILEHDSIPGCKLRHVRYYDKLFDVDFPTTFKFVKEARQASFVDNVIPYSEESYFDVQRECNEARKEIRCKL